MSADPFLRVSGFSRPTALGVTARRCAPLTRPAPAGESAGSGPPSPARGEGWVFKLSGEDGSIVLRGEDWKIALGGPVGDGLGIKLGGLRAGG